MGYVDWTSLRFREHVAAHPIAAATPCGRCGHRRDAHYGYGPCLVAISAKSGLDLPSDAKAGPRGPLVSNCPCPVFHRPIGPVLASGDFQ